MDGTAPPKTPHILIIDDDQAILQSFRSLLSRQGYNVETAETARAGLEMAEKNYYDLAVIDVKLPDLEGTKILSQMKKRSPNTKKIIMTGYPSLENAASSVNLHADAYLMKPVNPEEFLRVVNEKLREHSEDDNITEEKVMDWVETRYLKAKHQPVNVEKQKTAAK